MLTGFSRTFDRGLNSVKLLNENIISEIIANLDFQLFAVFYLPLFASKKL